MIAHLGVRCFNYFLYSKVVNSRKKNRLNEALFCLTSCRLVIERIVPPSFSNTMSVSLIVRRMRNVRNREGLMLKFHAGKSKIVVVGRTFQSKMVAGKWLCFSQMAEWLGFVYIISGPVFPNSKVSIKVLTWLKFML